MTYVYFQVQDEQGNNLAGIDVQGKSSYGFGVLSVLSGSHNFDTVTNSSGKAGFDPGNGLVGGSGSYTASGSGYKPFSGVFTIPALNGGNITVPVVLQSVSGKGSQPIANLSTTQVIEYVGIVGAVVLLAVGIAYALVK